jgi:hypothetical protein
MKAKKKKIKIKKVWLLIVWNEKRRDTIFECFTTYHKALKAKKEICDCAFGDHLKDYIELQKVDLDNIN